MRPRKKNKFFTFIFSFIPGAAEMYMGFMRSGFSILFAFCAPILVTGILYGANYLAMLSVIVYFIAFFHARNVASAPDAEFEALEDKFIWEEIMNINSTYISPKTCRKMSAIALILVGISGLWLVFKKYLYMAIAGLSDQNVTMIKSIVNTVPRLAFSILVIVVGIILIRGKKKELVEANAYGTGAE